MHVRLHQPCVPLRDAANCCAYDAVAAVVAQALLLLMQTALQTGVSVFHPHSIVARQFVGGSFYSRHCCRHNQGSRGPRGMALMQLIVRAAHLRGPLKPAAFCSGVPFWKICTSDQSFAYVTNPAVLQLLPSPY